MWRGLDGKKTEFEWSVNNNLKDMSTFGYKYKALLTELVYFAGLSMSLCSIEGVLELHEE